MSDIADTLGGPVIPDEEENSNDFEPIPAAWYPLEIDSAEIKDTKRGDGKYVQLEVTVLGNNHAGRKLWPTITLQNINEKAVAIGRKELAQIGHALRLKVITDCTDLVGGRLMGKVKVTNDEQYGPGNDVSAYKPMEDCAAAPAFPPEEAEAPVQAATTATPPVQAKPAPTKAPVARGKRPWEK